MWSVTPARPSCSRTWGSDVAKSKAKAPEPPPPPPPLTPLRGAAFEKDVKRLKKRGKDLEKLRTMIERLCSHGPLDPNHHDHPLSGPWKGLRDCHIEPDWLLIYRKNGGDLELVRTGNHSELFGK
jgi:mRNA interferase YafQ